MNKLRTKFFRKFNWIKQRCNDEKAQNYKRYWWKWIKCEWNSFGEFYEDMYESYLKHCEEYWENNTTIDRIDSNWNYCKNNCRWVCNREQHINTSRNRIYEYNWEKMCATDRARKLGYKDRSFLSKLDNWVPLSFIIEQPWKRYCKKWHEKYPPNEKKWYAITKIERNKEYMKSYKEKNKEKIREYNKQYLRKYKDHEYYKRERQRQKFYRAMEKIKENS